MCLCVHYVDLVVLDTIEWDELGHDMTTCVVQSLSLIIRVNWQHSYLPLDLQIHHLPCLKGVATGFPADILDISCEIRSRSSVSIALLFFH